MLQRLSIKDFILIQNVELEFKHGLTIFTGETGSGKSMLLHALSLILGERANADLIRVNAEIAFICAEFSNNQLTNAWLNENGFAIEEDIILIKRSIDKQGKNRAHINGMVATSQQLRSLTNTLIQIQSQHAQQNLLQISEQRKILDEFCHTQNLVNEVSKFYKNWQIAIQNLTNAKIQFEKEQENAEYLSWVMQDLKQLNPQEDEWQELQQEHKLLQHSSDIINNIQAMQNCITDVEGMPNILRFIQQKSNDVKKFDASLEEINVFIESINIQVNELENFLEKYLQKIDIDPERLSYLDQRLNTWITLARRLKVSNEDLYEEHIKIGEQLNSLDESHIQKLSQQVKIAKNVYLEHAKQLSLLRQKGAIKLSQQVKTTIQELAMKEADFSIEVKNLENIEYEYIQNNDNKNSYKDENNNDSDKFSEYGIDKITFLLSTHKQASYKPLNKVASGGELSRIALAITVATQQNNTIPTLIFDEIDSGISGITAQKIGALLSQLSQNQQIICITHLAQVAAYANQHITVSKHTKNDITIANIYELNLDQQLQELARLIGGDIISAETIQHAKNMIENSKVLT
ncbi:MAG: hypothetical protein RLZZ210_94 [Pseudomonadota bacterium]